MSFNAAASQLALVTWIREATGLPCVWQRQNKPTPRPSPYCTIKLLSTVSRGAHDSVEQNTDLTRVGQEVEEKVIARRFRSFSINCYSDDAEGDFCAQEILTRLTVKTFLPSAWQKLIQAGWYWAGFGTIQDLTVLFVTDWESRAQVDVKFHVTMSESEYAGFIKHLRATLVLNEDTDDEETTDLASDAS